MSRIGKQSISIPSGVDVNIEGNNIKAKGPLGELSLDFKDSIEVSINSGTIICERKTDDRESRSMHGLYRSLISNIIEGITSGFEIKLEDFVLQTWTKDEEDELQIIIENSIKMIEKFIYG